MSATLHYARKLGFIFSQPTCGRAYATVLRMSVV